MWPVIKGVVTWLGLIVGSAFALVFLWYIVTGSGCLLRVPGNHDPALVGQWQADAGMPRAYILLPNGTGKTGYGGKPLQWGTQGGTFVEKYFSTDAWARREFTYSLSDDGRQLTLTRTSGKYSRTLTYRRVDGRDNKSDFYRAH